MGILTSLKWHTYRTGRRAKRTWHSLWRDQRLDAIARADAALATPIARALRQAAAPPTGPAREWEQRIEDERLRMLRSTEVLSRGVGPDERAPDVPLAEACAGSIAPPAGLLLHHLIRETRPAVALELGTNVGISAAYQASALQAVGGTLTTLEGMSGRLERAKWLHARLGLDNVDFRLGPFQRTLEPALSDMGPVEFAFLDGHHEHGPTLRYFDLVCRHAADALVVVFDDIRWSDGMRRAWREVREDPRVETSVDLYRMGLCVVRRESADTTHFPPVELWVDRGK